MTDTERAITDIGAAERLGVSAATLKGWRQRRTGPRFIKIGRAVRYLPSDLDEFIRRNTISTTMSDIGFVGTV